MLDLLQRKAGDTAAAAPTPSVQAGWAWDHAAIAARTGDLRIGAPEGLAEDLARAMG